jgi:hypothetical protein
MTTPDFLTLRSWLTGVDCLGGADASVLTLECVPLRLDPAARILSGHSLTQRTETAICFWPWGPR